MPLPGKSPLSARVTVRSGASVKFPDRVDHRRDFFTAFRLHHYESSEYKPPFREKISQRSAPAADLLLIPKAASFGIHAAAPKPACLRVFS
jgi:hypothetical protein